MVTETSTQTISPKPQRDEYTARINRVIDYIEHHLEDALTLETLASVACFSPYHFHRIFSAMVGETLNQFIQRVRVEKAATLLISHPHRSITDVALSCGYGSSGVFARAFKEVFGMSATQWRAGGCERFQKNGQEVTPKWTLGGEMGKDWGILGEHWDDVTRTQQWRIRVKDMEPATVVVKEMPACHVAYVRYVGRYQGMAEVFAQLFNKLMKWAGPRGLLQDPGARWLAVYHDNPGITDDHKLRTSVCLTVPEGTRTGGEVGSMTLAGGKYAVGSFRLNAQEYAKAWYALVGGWLPESGYQPDDRHCFELFPQDQGDCQDERHRVDICVPVRPL